MTRRRRRARGIAAAVVTALGATTLAACSSSSSGPPALTWYINPDGGGSNPKGGGQAQLAQECAAASGGKYTINVQLLPNSASAQRIQLLRRLAANDPTMDLMSVDPAFVTEFAAAGYYAPVPADVRSAVTGGGVVQSSLNASMWDGKLIAVPFWANTQLLWYRKSVAAKAGLDMSKPVSWDQLIAAARSTHTAIGVQAALYEGYAVWINALVAGAGGQIVDNPNAGYDKLKMGLDSQAGKDAAAVIAKVSSTGAGGPAMGSSQETQSLNLFQANTSSGFMVNWPYVYAALQSAKVPWLSDLGWTTYPQTVAGQKARPPFGGIELAVGRYSKHTALAYQAVQCITSVQHQADYMVGTGNPASAKAAYQTPEVKKDFPMAALIQQSLDDAATRPLTPYYGDISTALQEQFSPPGGVNARTPAKAQRFILRVLNGKALL